MAYNNWSDNSNLYTQFKLYTDVKRYTAIVVIVKFISTVKNWTNFGKLYGNSKGAAKYCLKFKMVLNYSHRLLNA